MVGNRVLSRKGLGILAEGCRAPAGGPLILRNVIQATPALAVSEADRKQPEMQWKGWAAIMSTSLHYGPRALHQMLLIGVFQSAVAMLLAFPCLPWSSPWSPVVGMALCALRYLPVTLPSALSRLSCGRSSISRTGEDSPISRVSRNSSEISRGLPR